MTNISNITDLQLLELISLVDILNVSIDYSEVNVLLPLSLTSSLESFRVKIEAEAMKRGY